MLGVELKTALRVLFKMPAVTLPAVLVLVLGIAANSAIFSIVEAVLLRPLPYGDPERVVMVWTAYPQAGTERSVSSLPDYRDWREQADSFDDLAVFNISSGSVAEDEPEVVYGSRVSPNFFAVLGVEPMLGRDFAAASEEDAENRVVLIGYDLWQRHFGGDPGIVGREIRLSERPFTVLGVMPHGFEHPEPTWHEAEYWLPMLQDRWGQRGNRSLRVIGRLAAGVEAEAAGAELNTIAERLEAEYPDTNRGVRATVVPIREQLVGELKTPLTLALASVGFVLLIACVNLTQLLLARAHSRQRETAVRMALGASRGAVVRQALFESLWLTLLGGAAGLLVGAWLSRLVVALVPGDITGLDRVSPNLPVAAFTLGIAFAAGLLSGLIPALFAGGQCPFSALRAGAADVSGGRSGKWTRNTLLVAEVAVAVPLLLGAALLAQSLVRLRNVDTGMARGGALTFRLSLPARYESGDQRRAFFEQLIDRLAALPGVRAAGTISSLPLTSLNDMERSFTIERNGELVEVGLGYRVASRGYFEALRIPRLAGRTFERHDAAAERSAVAVVNEAAARELWPGRNAVGQRLRSGRIGDESDWVTVVGVVGSVRHRGLRAEPIPEVFWPSTRDVWSTMAVVVATEGSSAIVAGAVRQAVREMDARLPISNWHTLEEVHTTHLADGRLLATVGGTFALLALLQMAAGLVGIVTFWVSRRTRELGVRQALGARPGDLFALVTRQCMLLVGIGLGLGLLGSAGAVRGLGALLFGIQPTHPPTFVAVPVTMAALAFAAASWPARWATRVDPVTALRDE